MPDNFNQTAVLIFSRSARQEAAVKVFDPHANLAKNKALAQSLIRQTIATAKRSQLPVFFHSTPDQGAGTFGENFADAVESVLNRGFSQVIAIGNDCPALQAKDLVWAAQQLETSSMVLGPATDGG
ncbi:MAG: DUF2064 domain-containing protein, partial [Saprospiraceae bacterium]